MAILYLLVNLSLSTHEYYVTNSSNITQDHSCIVDDKDLHPCFSLDGMADYLTSYLVTSVTSAFTSYQNTILCMET